MFRPTLRKMTQFNIEIVSDTVCPWCYVGKKKLETAIAQFKKQHPEDTFSTTWKPYYLNPDSPKTGTSPTSAKHCSIALNDVANN
jgi:predicted DsbA family dithiol-disulfide isomerase